VRTHFRHLYFRHLYKNLYIYYMAGTVRIRSRRSARSTQSRRRKIVGGGKLVGILRLIFLVVLILSGDARAVLGDVKKRDKVIADTLSVEFGIPVVIRGDKVYVKNRQQIQDLRTALTVHPKTADGSVIVREDGEVTVPLLEEYKLANP
jgi:hypothetical protein